MRRLIVGMIVTATSLLGVSAVQADPHCGPGPVGRPVYEQPRQESYWRSARPDYRSDYHYYREPRPYVPSYYEPYRGRWENPLPAYETREQYYRYPVERSYFPR